MLVSILDISMSAHRQLLIACGEPEDSCLWQSVGEWHCWKQCEGVNNKVGLSGTIADGPRAVNTNYLWQSVSYHLVEEGYSWWSMIGRIGVLSVPQVYCPVCFHRAGILVGWCMWCVVKYMAERCAKEANSGGVLLRCCGDLVQFNSVTGALVGILSAKRG